MESIVSFWVIKLLKIIRDLPLWLLVGISLAMLVILFFPNLHINISRPWLTLILVFSSVFAFTKGVDIGLKQLQSWRFSNASRRSFHATPIIEQCYWHVSKQPDDSEVSQLVASIMISNRCSSAIYLISVRVIKLLFWGDVLQTDIHIENNTDRVVSKSIPPNETLSANIFILVRGRVKRKINKQLKITLGIADSNGYMQKVRVVFKSTIQPNALKQVLPIEVPCEIADPLEKEIISVLQSEISRYTKCGRSVGGLGSICIKSQSRLIHGVGHDYWIANSPENQSIISNCDSTNIKSDNLEALLVLFKRLNEDDKKKFRRILLDRIDPDIGYLQISYFIVCVLLKIGYLSEALYKAKTALPQNETKAFGLSNVLMLLNGLLRYCHSDFTPEMLDDIERFIQGLQEHTFMVAEKITSIRSSRLLVEAESTIP